MLNAPRRILRATPPAAGPHSRGVGCGVLAVLCWLGWLAGLGWAGDAGKDELGRLGWPGQAGWVCLYTFSFLFGCCFFVFSFNLFMLFLTLCSSFGSLRGSIFAPFWHLWGSFGVPGASLGSFEHTFWAALSPKVQNVCKRWFPNPKGVILGTNFGTFFVSFSKKNECVESVGSQVVFSALFRGSRDRLTLHPLQPAQSNHSFSCSGSP